MLSKNRNRTSGEQRMIFDECAQKARLHLEMGIRYYPILCARIPTAKNTFSIFPSESNVIEVEGIAPAFLNAVQPRIKFDLTWLTCFIASATPPRSNRVPTIESAAAFPVNGCEMWKMESWTFRAKQVHFHNGVSRKKIVLQNCTKCGFYFRSVNAHRDWSPEIRTNLEASFSARN